MRLHQPIMGEEAQGHVWHDEATGAIVQLMPSHQNSGSPSLGSNGFTSPKRGNRRKITPRRLTGMPKVSSYQFDTSLLEMRIVSGSRGQMVDPDYTAVIVESTGKKTIISERKENRNDSLSRLPEVTQLEDTECDECGKHFSAVAYLLQHKRSHQKHPTEYSCRFCDKKFKHLSKLKYHERKHSSEKPYKCEMCGIGFKSSFNLNRHMQTHTGAKPEKKYSCDICGKLFMFSCKLEEHKLRHAVERPFECETCGKTYAWKEMLKDHEKIHKDPNAFTCKICDEKFAGTQNLQRHMRRHNCDPALPSFICDVCGRSLSSSSALSRHMELHNNDDSANQETQPRPYQCATCQKGFTSKGDLHSQG